MEPDAEGNSLGPAQLTLLSFVFVLAIGGVGYYYFQTSTKPEYTEEELQAINQTEQMLLAKISESAEASVLKDTIPAVAPVENPVEQLYTNPFE